MYIEFTISGDLAGLVTMQGTTINEDFDDEIKKVPQKLYVPVHKSVEWGSFNGRKSSCLAMLIIKGAKNATGRDMCTISRYIMKICLPNP